MARPGRLKSTGSTGALPSGSALRFIEAQLLHFPGGLVTCDTASHMLFSGDIRAAPAMN